MAAGPEGALDARAWEMVSPVEKNGGEVESPGGAGAGAFQAAASGNSLAFGSTASFGDAEGAAPVSQYLARRGAGGWTTANLTPLLGAQLPGGSSVTRAGCQGPSRAAGTTPIPSGRR
jgi:hypothetical protein